MDLPPLDQHLRAIASRRSTNESPPLSARLNTYRIRASQRLSVQTWADAAAAALAVETVFDGTTVDLERVDVPMREAYERLHFSEPLGDLRFDDAEAAEGFLSAWKGKYFEILVRERLAAGETVGPYILEEGQTVLMPDDPTNAGWDLAILDESGEVVEQIQLKASESVDYISRALEGSPHPVLAIDDVAIDGSDSALSAADITFDEVDGPVREALADGSVQGALEDATFWIAPVVIVATEAHAVTKRGKDVGQGMRDGVSRLTKSAVAQAAGYASGLVVPWTGSATAFATRLGTECWASDRDTRKRVLQRTEEAVAIRDRLDVRPAWQDEA